MKKIFGIIMAAMFICLKYPAYSQRKDSLKHVKDSIKLERAEILQAGTFDGKRMNKIKGNVVFSHRQAYLYCDSAYQYHGENFIEAFGNVKIVKGDSLTFTGDHLKYKSDKQEALMIGNAELQNKKGIKRRHRLKYKL